MFRARTWSALLLVSAMVFLMGARQVPLTDPQPIAVPAGLKVEQVSKAIRAALAGRAWAVTSEEPGHIVSTLNVREHMAKIDIVYDVQTITIKYLDSGELMYAAEEGAAHDPSQLSELDSESRERHESQSRARPVVRRCSRSRSVPIRCARRWAMAGVATLRALRERRSGLQRNDFGAAPLATWIGRVAGLEEQPLPRQLADWDCRNNRLAWRGLLADGFIDAVARRARALRRRPHRRRASAPPPRASARAKRPIAARCRRPLSRRTCAARSFTRRIRSAISCSTRSGSTGLSVTVATACSSSAKVFAQAERLIRLGLADAAVVGGVDTLCGSVLFGFNSLELVSPEPCRPFDVERRGISLGEAAGFALLEREARRRPRGCSATANRATRTTCRRRIPKASARELALDDALARARARRRATSTTSTCTARRARRTTRSKRALVAELFPGAHARQLDQGLDRPHARRGRHRRSGDQPARARARLAARHAQHADARSGLRPADPPRQRERRSAPRAELLVRLRRQQLRAGVRRATLP